MWFLLSDSGSHLSDSGSDSGPHLSDSGSSFRLWLRLRLPSFRLRVPSLRLRLRLRLSSFRLRLRLRLRLPSFRLRVPSFRPGSDSGSHISDSRSHPISPNPAPTPVRIYPLVAARVVLTLRLRPRHPLPSLRPGWTPASERPADSGAPAPPRRTLVGALTRALVLSLVLTNHDGDDDVGRADNGDDDARRSSAAHRCGS